ncbi:MAG: IS21 family transposase [Phycisphaerae bacterium]|jgi:transposase
MRHISEILRLKHEVGLSPRQIARSCGLGRTTVVRYLAQAAQAGLGWPLPPELDEAALQRRLCGPPPAERPRSRPLPDWDTVHRELRRPRVTLQLLWEEYRQLHPDGYGYTQFCEYYHRWRAPLEVTLRQHHVAGEKTFLDWAGDALCWHDSTTGEDRPAWLFVAILGASNYTFVRAYPDRRLASWIDAHVALANFLGGVTRLWIPDNCRTGVDQPCYYQPQIHRTYQELGDHYQVAILPTRTYAARDKAKVEGAVLHTGQRLLARLRDQVFFSLGALNTAIDTLLVDYNERPFQKLRGSRRALFLQLDQPALQPLPAYPYELGEWRTAVANIDYHVQVDWHFYSVPYTLTRQQVEVRLSARLVEIFHRGRRVALHPRSDRRGGYTTDPSHRPKSHQQHLEWTPSRLIAWARTIGPQTGLAVTRLLEQLPHPEQGYRGCLGLMRLARTYGQPRLEAACQRALVLDACTYRHLKAMLAAQLDQQPLSELETIPTAAPLTHANLRGQAYYQLPGTRLLHPGELTP